MRTELLFPRVRRRIAIFTLVVLMTGLGMARHPAHAGLLDFLFGKSQPAPAAAAPPPPATDFNPFGMFNNAPPPGPAVPSEHARFTGYCVRLCDGRHFPIQARNVTAAQMCQSFCPASATKVFSGSGIDHAVAHDGTRYADLANAYVYREKLVDGCTCNGRDSVGLAPIDISLDTTLRPGDIVATSTGLVAYSGSRVGGLQTAEFTPINAYPGLTPELRAKLGDMKVSPVASAFAEDTSPFPVEVTGSVSGLRTARP